MNANSTKQTVSQLDNKENENSSNKQTYRKGSGDLDKHSIYSQQSINSLASLIGKILRRLHLPNKIKVAKLCFCIVKDVPEYDIQKDYYKLYWIAFLENQMLLNQLKAKSEERNEILKNMMKVQASVNSQSNAGDKPNNRKKHNRRCAKEISKDEVCPYKNCGKLYGSEGSLNLHMKLKHNGGNKTDRERLAKSLVLAYTNNKPVPEVIINWPPGAIQEEAKKLNIDLSAQQISDIETLAKNK